MNDQTTLEKPEPVKVTLDLSKTIELPTAALALDLSDDAKTLYAACFDGVYSVDVESGERQQIGKHASYASGVKLVRGTNLLISAGYDGALQWHNLDDKSLVRKVDAHTFWSWDLAVSPDGTLAASVTGQYLSGGYKYEPAPTDEPTVKIFDAHTGELRRAFELTPPVLCATFSPDSRYVAVANLMGDIRVWDTQTGEEAAAWNTPDMTSWGISKSPYYVGGIHGACFSPDGEELYVCGMGPMYDPMAANGKQTWQRFAWRESPPRKVDEIHSGESGTGLMETIVFHPSGKWFVMTGKLAFGTWSMAAFDAATGAQSLALNVEKTRATEAMFSPDGARLFLSGALPQERPKDGKCPPFGSLLVYECG